MKKSFTIRLGYTCNNNCIMCSFSDKLGDVEMGTEEVKRYILLAKKEKVIRILLTGGEPTIRKDFLQLVYYAVKLGIPEIEIQTNGRMFYYEEFARNLANMKKGNTVVRFLLPIYGHNEGIHDKITRSPGSFRQTVQGIKNLLKHNQTFVVKTVIMRTNYKYIPDIVKFSRELGLNSMSISSMCIGDLNKNAENLIPSFKEVIPYLERALKISERSDFRIFLVSIPLCLIKGRENNVREGFYFERILVKDPDKEKRELNVPKNSTIDSFNKVKLEKCKKCKFFKKCGGVWEDYIKIYGSDEFIPVE